MTHPTDRTTWKALMARAVDYVGAAGADLRDLAREDDDPTTDRLRAYAAGSLLAATTYARHAALALAFGGGDHAGALDRARGDLLALCRGGRAVDDPAWRPFAAGVEGTDAALGALVGATKGAGR